jgi:DNA end-binding protein Ku
MARAVWSGSITFGLVSVGVKAFTAVHDHDVHFHQIDAKTGARVGNQKVDKESGGPVDADDIQLGYEISKGRYVTFARDEIDELRPASTRTVSVSDFVVLDEIDPVFYEHTYWLVPSDDASEHAYRLLAKAMEETNKVGIGCVVMRNKQYLAAIRPLDGALAMSTMRFADEVVGADDVEGLPSKRGKLSEKELGLATQIIDALSSDWDPDRYHDTFTEELRSMIEAKANGEEVHAEAEAEPTGTVVDLMAALEQSVAAARGGRSSGDHGGSAKAAGGDGHRRRQPKKKAPTKRPHRARKSA